MIENWAEILCWIAIIGCIFWLGQMQKQAARQAKRDNWLAWEIERLGAKQ